MIGCAQPRPAGCSTNPTSSVARWGARSTTDLSQPAHVPAPTRQYDAHAAGGGVFADQDNGLATESHHAHAIPGFQAGGDATGHLSSNSPSRELAQQRHALERDAARRLRTVHAGAPIRIDNDVTSGGRPVSGSPGPRPARERHALHRGLPRPGWAAATWQLPGNRLSRAQVRCELPPPTPPDRPGATARDRVVVCF